MDTFGIIVQLCLAAAAFSTLIYKRQREKPRRPLRIWGFDVSKQLVGGIIVHSQCCSSCLFWHQSRGRCQGKSMCLVFSQYTSRYNTWRRDTVAHIDRI
ncbi:unnamed protein product [Rhizopus microsporus]